MLNVEMLVNASIVGMDRSIKISQTHNYTIILWKYVKLHLHSFFIIIMMQINMSSSKLIINSVRLFPFGNLKLSVCMEFSQTHNYIIKLWKSIKLHHQTVRKCGQIFPRYFYKVLSFLWCKKHFFHIVTLELMPWENSAENSHAIFPYFSSLLWC